MIENIRKYTGLMIVVLVLLFVGLVFLDGGSFARAIGGKPAMQVGDTNISQKEFNRQSALIQLADAIPGNFPLPRETRILASHYLGDDAIENERLTASAVITEMARFLQVIYPFGPTDEARFITNRLTVQKAGLEYGVTPSPAEVESFVENVLFADPEGNYDQVAYSEFLKNSVSMIGGNRGFNEYIRDLLTAQNLAKLKGGGIAPEMETVRLLHDIEKQVINGQKITLDLATYEGKMNPSEEELKAYFEENRENYKSDELRKVSYVHLAPDWETTLKEVTEEKEKAKELAAEKARKEAESKKKAEEAARKKNQEQDEKAKDDAPDSTPASDPASKPAEPGPETTEDPTPGATEATEEAKESPSPQDEATKPVGETGEAPDAPTPADETSTGETAPENPVEPGSRGDPGQQGEPAPAPAEENSTTDEPTATEETDTVGKAPEEETEESARETEAARPTPTTETGEANPGAKDSPATEDSSTGTDLNDLGSSLDQMAKEDKNNAALSEETTIPEVPKTAKEQLNSMEKREAVEALTNQIDDFYEELVNTRRGEDLNAAAKEMDLEVKTTDFFSQKDPPELFGQRVVNSQVGTVAAAVFRQTTEGDPDELLSEPLQTNDGWIVFRFDDLREAEPLSFEEARTQVSLDLKKKMAREALVAEAKELHDKLDAALEEGKSFTEAAKELEQEPTEIKDLKEGQVFSFGPGREQKMPNPPEFDAAKLTNPGEIAPVEFTPSEEEVSRALIIYVDKREIVKDPAYLNELEQKYQNRSRYTTLIAFENWLQEKYNESEVVAPKPDNR